MPILSAVTASRWFREQMALYFPLPFPLERRSVRMRSRSPLAGSRFGCCLRQSSVNFPSTAALRDGGSVAFEVGLDAFEISDGFIESGELLFDFRDDLLLLFKWSNGNSYLCEFLSINIRLANSCLAYADLMPIVCRLEEICDVFRADFISQSNTY